MDRPMLPQVPRVSATQSPQPKPVLAQDCRVYALPSSSLMDGIVGKCCAVSRPLQICIALNSTTWTVDQNALVEALADGFDCRGGRPITAASCQWGYDAVERGNDRAKLHLEG